MPKVKICGVRRVEDALVAVEAGVDFLGLVLVPNRKRRISVDQAKRIVDAVKGSSANPPKVAGLFADQPMEEVREKVLASGVDMVQICGKETMKFCDEAPVPVIRITHVPKGLQGESEMEELEKRLSDLHERGHIATLDRLVPGLQGGTGKSFDWSLAARLSETGYEFMLAGGLTPENVGRAIREVNPWGVDVSSGVETRGVQDPEKIRRFVEEAGKARP